MGDAFKISPHDFLPGKMMVEYWVDGRFVAGIYPHQDGIRVVSKYMVGVVEERGPPRAAVILMKRVSV